MEKTLLLKIEQDNYYNYLKENSNFIKELTRHPNNYNQFKEFIKDKYHLRISDKINTAIDDIELISTVLNTLK